MNPVTERKLLALSLLAILLFALPSISYPAQRDQGEYAVLGQGLLHGQTLYVDLWNPKPPGVIFMYAAALAIGGPSIIPLRVLDVGWMLLTSWLLYLLGKRMYSPTVGLVAAFAFGTAYFSYGVGDTGQSDSFMVLPMVAAVYCLLRSRAGRDGVWMLVGGLALGFAFWMKYTSAALAIAVLPLLWWPAAVRRRLVVKLAAAGVGFLLISAPYLIYLWGSGGWDEFLRSIAVTGGYTAFGFGGSFEQAVGRLVGGILIFHIGLWVLAMVAAGHDLVRRRRGLPADEREPMANLVVWLWLLVTFVTMLAQRKLFPYHWIPMLAPLALLAARGFVLTLNWSGWAKVMPRLRPSWRGGLLVGLLLLVIGSRIIKEDAQIYPQFIAYSTGQMSAADYALNFGGYGGSHATSYLAHSMVADYLKAHTRPDQRIFVWGLEADLYFLAQRQPVSRFIYSYPLVAPWNPPAWQDEFIAAQRATPAAYIVVLNDDYLPSSYGRYEDSAGQLKYFPALQQVISRDYLFDRQIEDFTIYRRR